MSETTSIEWTDSTVNFWWGCTKVGPGCDYCYAETWAARFGEGLWGPDAPRRKIKGAVKLLHKLDNNYSWWSADHYIGGMHAKGRRRVFIQSMSDLFDKEVPNEWFGEAWTTIGRCDKLDIQIVTKRVSFVEKRLAGRAWPQHAGLIISVVNQEEADRDIPRLIELKGRLGIPWVGLSMEPLLGSVILRPEWLEALNWVIVGGESGQHARPMHIIWVRALRDQCLAAGVPFFFKQWGEWKSGISYPSETPGKFAMLSNDPNGWMGSHAVLLDHYPRQFTMFGSTVFERRGKKAAGRMLDGIEHNGVPA